MKIGIDITMLAYKGSGVASYTYNLAKTLLKIDQRNEYKLFYSSLRKPKNFYHLEELKKAGAKIYNFPVPHSVLKILWNRLHILPVEWLIGEVDFVLSSDYLRPPLSRCTIGLTMIHDLIWKLHPEWHTDNIVSFHDKKMRWTIEKSDIIFAPSYSTKSDLIKLFPQTKRENKIHVIYEGIDERYRPINNKKELKKVLAKYEIKYPKKYLLYVGAIEPRKNLETSIISFYSLLKDKKYYDYEFLIVGRAGWKNEQIFELINILQLEKKVKFVGFVEDEDLPYFYNAASLIIYLSHYEGFGLPPLEAARCEKPSLIYRNSSLKEVFPKTYPFAEEGNEIAALKQILEKNVKINFGFAKKYDWKDYCLNFLKILKKYAR